MRISTRLLTCLAVACALLAATRVQADTLAVDSNTSYLKLDILIVDPETGDENPIAFPQAPGSDSTSLGGTLEFSSAGGFATLAGGSNLVFANQPTPMQPDVNGVAGSAPANYGYNLDLLGLATGVGAIRDALADVTGGPTPIVLGQFDVTGFLLTLTAGRLDVNLTSSFGDIVQGVDISNNAAANLNATLGTFDGQLVHIPISLDVVIPVEVSEGFFLPITARFTGEINAMVPEPGTVALMAFAGIGLCVAGRRRLRRR